MPQELSGNGQKRSFEAVKALRNFAQANSCPRSEKRALSTPPMSQELSATGASDPFATGPSRKLLGGELQ